MGVIDLLFDMIKTVCLVFLILLGMYICSKALRDINKFINDK